MAGAQGPAAAGLAVKVDGQIGLRQLLQTGTHLAQPFAAPDQLGLQLVTLPFAAGYHRSPLAECRLRQRQQLRRIDRFL
ncbi:arginine repressor [Edwardsiella piscicida]|nr:arginine repressor [Edwardsiella piscicida]